MPATMVDLAEDFEAWAALAARVRILPDAARAIVLERAGVSRVWDAVNEEWSRRMNDEIRSGALARPNRYLALCEAELARSEEVAPATLADVALAPSAAPLPFSAQATAEPSSHPGARAVTDAAAAAFFADLRASSASVVPPLPRSGAHTLVSPPIDGDDDEAPPPTVATPETHREATLEERFLADFRASLMPPEPIVPAASGQGATMQVPATGLLDEVSRRRAREVAEGWSLEALATFVDGITRATSSAQAEAAWTREGLARTVDREFVRATLEIRLRREPSMAARFPHLAPRRG